MKQCAQVFGVVQAESGSAALVIVLMLVFLLKTLFLGVYVTPLWDIPDEIGHLAYVMQVAEGGGLPVLGQAMIPGEIMSHVLQVNGAEAISNWIAQHPPLYYYVAALPFWVTQKFTSDIEILYRSPRLVSAACGTLLLLVMYRNARLLGLNSRSSACLAGCIASVPMVSHMSSGTSHDIPLFLVGALVAFYFSRYVLTRTLRDVYLAAVWLAVACAVKATAWVLLVPFLILSTWELRGVGRLWIGHVAGVNATALWFPMVWMARSIAEYGDAFFTANTKGDGIGCCASFLNPPWLLAYPLKQSVWEYLDLMPVVEHFLRNFYGMFGGIGTGVGRGALMQLDGLPLFIFSVVLWLCAGVLLLRFAGYLISYPLASGDQIPGDGFRAFLVGSRQVSILKVFICLIVVLFFLVAAFSSLKDDVGMNARLVPVAVILALGAGSLVFIPFVVCAKARLFVYGLTAFLFFVIVLFSQVYEYYLLDGRLRAMHGRYLYPVLPWLLISLCVALVEKAWAERLLLAIFVLLTFAEVDAYTNQVLPFVASAL